MKRIFKTAVALTLVAAFIVPSVAAGSDDRALAQESYYSSYGKPASLPAPAPARAPAVASGDSGTWKVVALGAGALVLVLGAAELVTLGRLRRTTVA